MPVVHTYYVGNNNYLLTQMFCIHLIVTLLGNVNARRKQLKTKSLRSRDMACDQDHLVREHSTVCAHAYLSLVALLYQRN